MVLDWCDISFGLFFLSGFVHPRVKVHVNIVFSSFIFIFYLIVVIPTVPVYLSVHGTEYFLNFTRFFCSVWCVCGLSQMFSLALKCKNTTVNFL